MLEINNQRKAFLDMLAWSEGTDNGRRERKPEIMNMTSLWASYFSGSPITLAKLITLNPKLKSTGARRYSFFPVGGMPTANAWPERLLSKKSGRCGGRLRAWRFTYD